MAEENNNQNDEYDGVNWDDYDEDEDYEPPENNNNVQSEPKIEEPQEILEEPSNYTPKNSDYRTSKTYHYKPTKHEYPYHKPFYRGGHINKAYKNYNNNPNTGRFSKTSYSRGGFFNSHTKYNSTLNSNFGRKDFYKKSFHKSNYNNYSSSFKNGGITQKEFEIDDSEVQDNKKIPMKDFVEIDDDSYTFNTIDNSNRDKRNNDFFEKNSFPKKFSNKDKNFSNKNSFFSEKYKKKENLREFGEIKDFKEQIKEGEKKEDNLELQKPFFYNSQKDNPPEKEDKKKTLSPIKQDKILYINDFINMDNITNSIKNIGNEIIKLLKEKMENNLEKEYGALNIKAKIYEPTKNRTRQESLNNYYELPMMGNDNRMQYNVNMNMNMNQF